MSDLLRDAAVDSINEAKDEALAGLIESTKGYVDETKAARVAELAGKVMSVRVNAETAANDEDRAYWVAELAIQRATLDHAIDSERLLLEATAKKVFIASVDAAVEAAGRMAGKLLPVLLKAATGMI